MIQFADLWHTALVAAAALFPLVNPLGTALIVEPHLSELSRVQRVRASFLISLYSLSVCLFSIYLGVQIFSFFGISIPAVQISGGLLIAKMGFEVLYGANNLDSSQSKDAQREEVEVWGKTELKLFYPLAFPMTTGAGTISVLLTLAANSGHRFDIQHFGRLAAISLGSLFMCILVFFCYAYSNLIFSRVGAKGASILNRISGFLTICIGIQIFINGLVGVVRLLSSL